MNPRAFVSTRFPHLLLTLCALILTLVPIQPALAQGNNQWQIDFFPNPNWAGQPVYTHFNFSANFNWGTASPGPNVPADNFSARFRTQSFFYAGVHRFSIAADDEFVLFVDDTIYQDTRGRHLSGKTLVMDIPLTQGNHSIKIDYREFTGDAFIFVNWTRINGGGNPMPPANPGPNSATSVQTRYGDFTPCIQRGLHQVNCFHPDGAWDSPNEGSIQMEPQIVVWGNCTANAIQTRQLFANQPPQQAVCSRTEAGWFPR